MSSIRPTSFIRPMSSLRHLAPGTRHPFQSASYYSAAATTFPLYTTTAVGSYLKKALPRFTSYDQAPRAPKTFKFAGWTTEIGGKPDLLSLPISSRTPTEVNSDWGKRAGAGV